MPNWLQPLCHVRVKPDDITGIPLGDFLTNLRALTDAATVESYINESLDSSKGQDASSGHRGVQEYSFP